MKLLYCRDCGENLERGQRRLCTVNDSECVPRKACRAGWRREVVSNLRAMVWDIKDKAVQEILHEAADKVEGAK